LIVCIDSSILLHFLRPDTRYRLPDGKSEEEFDAADRVRFLIENLEHDKAKIIIPTPVLGEVLVHSGKDTDKFLETIRRSNRFDVAAFDQISAIESAELHRRFGTTPANLRGNSTRQIIKIDRQIVAIAKVKGATTLYCDDETMAKFAETIGIKVIKLQELPARPLPPQRELDLPQNEDS